MACLLVQSDGLGGRGPEYAQDRQQGSGHAEQDGSADHGGNGVYGNRVAAQAAQAAADGSQIERAGRPARLYLSPKTVERNVAAVFDKLGLPPDNDNNRRVLAVIAYLRAPA